MKSVLIALLCIVAILFLFFFLYWMIEEGDNVKRQQREDYYDAIEDNF